MWKPCLAVKNVADVHYHSDLTWWALLMINDETIILIDIHIFTEKTWIIRETTCSVQQAVYN